jgi:hypothetical protein
MFESTETQIFQLIKPFAELYPAAYEVLHKEKPIKCATTGTTFDAAPVPVAVIMDVSSNPRSRSIIVSWATVLRCPTDASDSSAQWEFYPNHCLGDRWGIHDYSAFWSGIPGWTGEFR